MIQNGLKPTKQDHRDYDFKKSFGAVAPPSFPTEYITENYLWCPDQNSSEPIFGNPALPYGCTDYTQADLCADDDGRLYNPLILENITHANAKNGLDLRIAMDGARKAYNRTAYYNIKGAGAVDTFDAVRLAMYFISASEKRSVSVGSPWFYQFTGAGYTGIVPIPDSFNLIYATWHNWKVGGWKTIDGQPYLICKSWQGNKIGDGGYLYFSRPLFNSLMAIRGSVAFTLTNMKPDQVQTIDMNVIARIVSYIRYLFNI